MKVTQTTETKKTYQAPVIDKVNIDNEVSLIMSSTPPGPGTGGGTPWAP